MPTVQIHGLVELQRALATLRTQAPKQIAFVNLKAANIVAAEVRREAPHGPHEGGGSVLPIGQAVTTASTPAFATVIVGGARTPHAAGAEYGGYIPRRGLRGISRRAKKALRLSHASGLTHLKKQPYLGPSLTKKAAEVFAMYEQMLSDLITRFEGK